jgi:divalent metal cation (Fe/Co/Zn/Cd) transporter
MGTIAMVLIGESIISITEMMNSEEPVEFEVFIIVIMGFNVLSKLILSIWCAKAAKRTSESKETLLTYANDHRNDCMSNAIGLLSVCLAFYAGGNWRFCDPVGAIVLSIYIFVNWGATALKGVKSLAGGDVSKKRKDEHMLRMLH